MDQQQQARQAGPGEGSSRGASISTTANASLIKDVRRVTGRQRRDRGWSTWGSLAQTIGLQCLKRQSPAGQRIAVVTTGGSSAKRKRLFSGGRVRQGGSEQGPQDLSPSRTIQRSDNVTSLPNYHLILELMSAGMMVGIL